MVPMIGHDEEVEGASFMPRAFCGSDDNALRKWEAGDLEILAVDAEIGGGTFGEQQRSMFRATHTYTHVKNSNLYSCNIIYR